MQISCPLSGLQRHNAVILDIESASDNTVRIRTILLALNDVLVHCRSECYSVNPHVLISNRVHISSTILAVSVINAGKIGGKMNLTYNSRSLFRYSHGFVVSVDDLLEYVEPNYE